MEEELVTEVHFDGVGTIALPQSRARRGVDPRSSHHGTFRQPPIYLPLNPSPGQIWSPMVNQSHKVVPEQAVQGHHSGANDRGASPPKRCHQDLK